MGFLSGESVRPSTVAANTLEKFTRQRYNDLRGMYKPVESGVLPTIGNDNYINLQSKIAGREAGQTQDLMNRAEDIARERRGLALSEDQQEALDLRRRFNKTTGVRRAKTLGELAAIDNDRISTAGVVDAGNSVYKTGLNSLATAAQIESQANAAGVQTGASGLEKLAGVASGAALGFMTGGVPGAVLGGGLSASAYF